ncbi:MAG: hypothetical protein ACXWC9_05840 [Pseudobdellovibrionaceae bacterium]
MERLSALSFWQPYAWLIVNGHADVDSRTWAPPAKRLGARIAVHASKRKVTRSEYSNFLEMIRYLRIKNYPKSPDEFEYGMIVGTVIVSGVTKTSSSYWAAKGYEHWLLKDPKRIQPIPFKGQRGWFQAFI